jgi:hypothetical protein
MPLNKSIMASLAVGAALLSPIAIPCAAFAQSTPLSQSQASALMQNPVVAAAVDACREDRERLCANVTPGGGRILRCLAAQAPAVSPQCKSALIRARGILAVSGIALQGPHN